MQRCLQLHIIFLFGILINYVESQTTYNCSINATCGCSINSAILTRIVGGESAASQTWGWAASLRYTSTNSHFCGGSIISNSHILTAAHCASVLPSPSSVRVYVGSIYLSVTAVVREVSDIYIHPNYSSTDQVNDLAILKLSSPLDLHQDSVDAVCLPNVSLSVLRSQEYPAPNTNLVAIGWGYLTEGSGTVSPTLQQVTIQAIAASSSYCEEVGLADSSVQFCAGVMPQGGKDTCQGDSGGPLLLFNSNHVWEQVGITSNGIGCAEPGLPGVYTRVAPFQSWINETINQANHFRVVAHLFLIPIVVFIVF